MLYKRDIKIVAVIIIFTVVLCGGIIIFKKDNEDLIGGNYFLHECLANKEEYVDSKNEFEKYFRPSNLPIINNREDVYKLIDEYYDKNYKDINIDNGFLDTPEDTILNYFSLLREAANPVDDFNLGCGSLGTGKVPYKIGYNFFTQRYKNNNSFKKYLKSFENIAHINLLKLREVPTVGEEKKYFFEIETIESSKKSVAYFAYYYGYIYLNNTEGKYKIDNIDIYGENYLCTPYHGWANDGRLVVEIKYGNWCNLVKDIIKVEEEGFEKRVYFNGKDGKEYKIIFYTLTNDNDIEIAQYIKNSSGVWENIYLNPNKCIEK